MPHQSLSANLSVLFAELAWTERPVAAAEAGFGAIEMRFLDQLGSDAFFDAVAASGMPVSCINASAGDVAAGELGFAGVPGAGETFRSSILAGLDDAARLGAPLLSVMLGRRDEAGADRQHALILENLAWAAEIARAEGVRIVLEPISPQLLPEYLGTSVTGMAGIIDEAGRPNIGLLADLFHIGLMPPSETDALFRNADRVFHIQAASVPDRHEPFFGDVDQAATIRALKRAGYVGRIGCEYVPAGTVTEGLEALASWAASLD